MYVNNNYYPGTQYSYGPPTTPYNPYNPGNYNYPYPSDIYRPTGPYQTGYVQGVQAASGASNGITTLSNSIGNIFDTICSVIANILNTIVNIIAKIITGILGFFGIGKKEDNSQANGPIINPPMMTPINGVGAPVSNFPPPPPGTDLNTATQIVQGDLANVRDPNQGIQIVSLHAKKSNDNREYAEEAAKAARKAAALADEKARELLAKAGKLTPQEMQRLISEIEFNKSKALQELKRAEDYTKATYDEALYAQIANDILTQRFPQIAGINRQAITEAWGNWVGGRQEKTWLFFNKAVIPAPQVFTNAVNLVNGYLSRIDQSLTALTAQRR